MRRAWPSSPVTVHLDADRPVLLGHLPEKEQEWRERVQWPVPGGLPVVEINGKDVRR